MGRKNSKNTNILQYKIAVLILGAGVVILSAGCGNKTMDRKEALNFALADAELSASDITIIRQELETENGKKYYEIEFSSEAYRYEYEINASSGAVEDVSIHALSPDFSQNTQDSQNNEQNGNGQDTQNNSQNGNGQDAQDDNQNGNGQDAQNNSQNSNGQDAQNDSQNGSGQPQPADNPVNTMDSAKTIALADAGLAETDVTSTKEKLDWDNGVAVYDIDFYSTDMEYEYEINAATGIIMDKSAELLGNPNSAPAGAGSLLDADRAKEIAVTHAGFTLEDVFFTKVKLEEEDGRMEYEIEFYKDRIEYEYKIDASTGSILEYESDYDD